MVKGKQKTVGIVNYGAYIPRKRMKVEDIINTWQNASSAVTQYRLLINERAVLSPDEDTNTLAIAAARQALERARVNAGDIGALILGTCTNPYDSRPSSTMVSEAIGVGPHILGGDIQFGGKSGTTALQIIYSFIASGMTNCGIAIGADTINRHIAPGDLYEATASAGAVALILGTKNIIAEIEDTCSYASDLSDFFRLEGERYIRSAMGIGAATWEVGLVHHSQEAARNLMKKLGTSAENYQFAVFQQPYGRTSYMVAEGLGFVKQQVDPGIVADQIGDTGSASSLLGLARVLNQAKAGDRILLISYGFGAGSDAISLRVTPEIDKCRDEICIVDRLLEDKIMVNYAMAAKYEYKYIKHEYPLSAYL